MLPENAVSSVTHQFQAGICAPCPSGSNLLYHLPVDPVRHGELQAGERS